MLVLDAAYDAFRRGELTGDDYDWFWEKFRQHGRQITSGARGGSVFTFKSLTI